MATITPISILNRIGAPGAPSFLSPGELAYNQPEVTAPFQPLDALYIGNGTSVSVLVGSARQVELWGNQTITGVKTIDIADLKVIGGQPNWLLQTDGNGNLSFTNAPGGGLTEVATDATLTGLGTVASPLGVVAHTVAVTADGVTISGNGTTASPLAVISHTVSVAVDGTTINGDGTAANPLRVDPDTIPVVTNATLTGNGTTASPLNVVPPITNATLTGTGQAGSPLGVVADTVPVATDGITITGNGTTGNPLTAMNGTVAVAVDGVTIGGEGVTASPLHVLPNSVTVATAAPITGNGTSASPIGLNTPLALQYGGTGVNASSNATLLTALGAASVASLAAYLPLSGGTMTGTLTLSGAPSGSLDAATRGYVDSAPNQTITLSGDATGSGTAGIATTVTGLRGHAISTTAPTDQQVLLWSASGSAWTPTTLSLPGGTITGVTAGTGLTGGGTSGSVTLALATPVSIANGGTNATTASAALANLGGLPLSGGALTGALTSSSTIAATSISTTNASATNAFAGPITAPGTSTLGQVSFANGVVTCGGNGITFATFPSGNGVTAGAGTFAFGWDSAISTSSGVSFSTTTPGNAQGWLVRTFAAGGTWNPIQVVAGAAALGSLTAWSYGSQSVNWAVTASDPRLKHNLAPPQDALATVNAIEVQQCDYRREGFEEHWDFTLLADEVQKVIPFAYIAPPDENGYSTLAPLHLIATLWRAVQQLSAQVEDLTAGLRAGIAM